jgi:protein-S-isoprenylcysteine O-methyltransferase Ste14
MTTLIFNILIDVIILIVWFGIFGPAMISSSNTIAVWFGTVVTLLLIILVTLSIIFIIIPETKKLIKEPKCKN